MKNTRIRAIVRALCWWAGTTGFLFISNNWELFSQFIKGMTPASLATLILPAAIGGAAGMYYWVLAVIESESNGKKKGRKKDSKPSSQENKTQ